MKLTRSRKLAMSGSALALLCSSASAFADPAATCHGNNAGLKLPPGFCATIFAHGIGHARHLIVAPDGTVYVNTWSGRYYHNDTPHPGGFIVALKDTNGQGKADKIERFGMTPDDGGHGGTGIFIYNGKVYAEESDRIDSYKLAKGDLAPKAARETVVTGMPLGGDHPMHPFIIDAKGDVFVDMGSATNSCQSRNRQPNVPGLQPCRELDTRGGTWTFDANKLDQRFSPEQRFATGLRNGEGFAFDSAGRLFATQHGRDQLWEDWPRFYKPGQGAELPAEELVQETKGADFGWPYCYYDGFQHKLVLAPEYGGDGGHKVGVCASKTPPVAAFPAHWAPNDLVIYKGAMFPAGYKDAAFLAFHGSWNRAPAPQGGYDVVVQPMKDGKPSGQWVTFADGFAGAVEEPGVAKHRPSGLAVGPDGALYVADDIAGTIYRITYSGARDAPLTAAPSAPTQTSAAANVLPPEGIHPNAGREAEGLPTPPGVAMADVVEGSRIFHGEEKHGTCTGCHGVDGQGGGQGPNLTDAKWLWSDGSLSGIEKTIANGVPHPKQYNEPMPPKGGADLDPGEIKAVAAYVWAIAHKGQQ